jgi:geranylgeranyl pyrophosphate synthase
MIHTASLIHDGVLDESDMRRGRILNFTSEQLEKSH